MFDEDIRDMDFSGGIRANRTFMEAVPAPNPIFPNIFMTYLELLKVTPEGVDMSYLRGSVHMPDKKPVPKQTFSRWIGLMTSSSSGNGILSKFEKREPLIRLEESKDDSRYKTMVLTEAGLQLARRMSRGETERDLIRIQREAYEGHINWMQSAEVKYMRELFAQGYKYAEVEEKLEEWKKENPTLTHAFKKKTFLDFPVPPEVTLEWLVEFQNCWKRDGTGGGDTKARQMMRDIGLKPDEYLLRMLSLAEWMEDGLVRLGITKDHYKENNAMSAIIGKFVMKAKMLEHIKRNNWKLDGLNIEEVIDNALHITEYVLKPSTTGPNDVDVVDTETGEVEGGLDFKSMTHEKYKDLRENDLVKVLFKQMEDLKKETAEREQKLLDRIDKLTDALMEKGRG